MKPMRWGKKPAADVQTRPPDAEEPGEDASVLFHVCCICGALLCGDPEDEINGEGWGRDICGNCNRTKNDEALTMGW
jgi:hypothetical protein